MVHEWIAAGAVFGVKAFFAVIGFGLCLFALLGLLEIIAGIVRALTGGRNEDKPY